MEAKLSDGMDMPGSLRIEMRFGGLYVVGDGCFCSVDSEKEGRDLIEELKKGENYEKEKGQTINQ